MCFLDLLFWIVKLRLIQFCVVLNFQLCGFHILVIDFSVVSNCNAGCFLLKHISLIICLLALKSLISKFGFCNDWLGSLGSHSQLWTELQPMRWCSIDGVQCLLLLLCLFSALIGLGLSCELRSFIGIIYWSVFWSFHVSVQLSLWGFDTK